MHNAVNKKEVGSTRVVHPVLVLLSSSLGGDIGASWARLKRQRHAGIVDRVDHLFGAAANRSIADLLVQGVYGMLEYIPRIALQALKVRERRCLSLTFRCLTLTFP